MSPFGSEMLALVRLASSARPAAPTDLCRAKRKWQRPNRKPAAVLREVAEISPGKSWRIYFARRYTDEKPVAIGFRRWFRKDVRHHKGALWPVSGGTGGSAGWQNGLKSSAA